MTPENASPIGLEHWPDHIWSDYPYAYVRFVTLRFEGESHLLFACVELLPSEIQRLPDYHVPQLKLPGGATVMSSLTVLTSQAAMQWYEQSLSGSLTIPGDKETACVRTVRLAPEPRRGNLIIAKIMTVPLAWTSQPRMHRMVPMEGLPEGVSKILSPAPGSLRLRDWLIEHCFIDLTAYPDCAGGLILLAANPIVRHVSHYPMRRLPDGEEVIGVRVTPRDGCALDTLRLRFFEMRPDGYSSMQQVFLNAMGEAEVILPQEVQETALEVSCTRRGLLSTEPLSGFFRSIGYRINPVIGTMSVPVPARSKRQGGGRHDVPIADIRLAVSGQVGKPAESGTAARLALLLSARSPAEGQTLEEVVFREDRQFAASFVRGLVSRAISYVLFVDPYFGFVDICDFAIAAWSGSCRVSILTGGGKAGWNKPLAHLATSKLSGEMMLTGLETINQARVKNGVSPVEVKVMGDPNFHDRFLVIDETVWMFGNSFNSLGNGDVSMVSKVRDVSVLLPMLLTASAAADPFAKFWEQTKPRDDVG